MNTWNGESPTQLASLFPAHILRLSLESTLAEEFWDQQSIGQFDVSSSLLRFEGIKRQVLARKLVATRKELGYKEQLKGISYTKLIIGPGLEMF